MNGYVRDGLIFAAGVLAGAGIVYLLIKDKYQKQMVEEIETVRSVYSERIHEMNKKTEESKKEKEPEKNAYSQISPADYDNKIAEKHFTDYTSFAKSQLKEELEKTSETYHNQSFDEHMAERESPEEDDISEEEEAELESEKREEEQRAAKESGLLPYPISRDEFLNDKSWYEKHDLNLYSDGVLTDERDNPIPTHEIEKMIGKEFDKIESDLSDPNVIYIRNEAMACDFEICKINYPQRLSDGGDIPISFSSDE